LSRAVDGAPILHVFGVSEDGGVPLHFRVESGNTTDDQPHRQDLLCKLVGRKDFRYVADCKLFVARRSKSTC
jgi:hypothetical protein